MRVIFYGMDSEICILKTMLAFRLQGDSRAVCVEAGDCVKAGDRTISILHDMQSSMAEILDP